MNNLNPDIVFVAYQVCAVCGALVLLLGGFWLLLFVATRALSAASGFIKSLFGVSALLVHMVIYLRHRGEFLVWLAEKRSRVSGRYAADSAPVSGAPEATDDDDISKPNY